MIWYDSAPKFGEGVTKYEGAPYDKDRTTFRSFEAARSAARKRIESEIQTLADELAVLDSLTAETCEKVRNPFA